MKMTRYSEPQILAILRQAESGVPVAELSPRNGSGLTTTTARTWPSAASHPPGNWKWPR